MEVCLLSWNLDTDALPVHMAMQIWFQGNLDTDVSVHMADTMVQEAGMRGYTLLPWQLVRHQQVVTRKHLLLTKMLVACFKLPLFAFQQ